MIMLLIREMISITASDDYVTNQRDDYVTNQRDD